MSRGPGRIERAIEAAFQANPHRAYTGEELVRLAYPDAYSGEACDHSVAWASVTGAPEPGVAKKHRVAVYRAAHNVAARLLWGVRVLDTHDQSSCSSSVSVLSGR